MIREGISKERAETMALNALSFLAGRQEDLERFLTISGIGVDEIRLRAADPDMLRAVTDFLLSDDTLVSDFCQEQKLDPRDVHMANHVLGRP